MTSSEIRSRFLEFFKRRGHAVIPSTSLVTGDERGVTNPTLFNTAGMQPLIPYLLGKPYTIDGHEAKRLVDVQKCLRTVDIDDIGDKTHATFFEMLGNWSLGDYFKKEAIEWSYELLTSKKEGFGLDPQRLYITVFKGDSNAEKDEEAAGIWRGIFKKHGVEGNRIFYLGANKNWWEAGENGPCGPDTEMYYDVANTFGGKGLTHEQFLKADDDRRVVEVWNDVFMQYEKKNGIVVGKLAKPSVDTGAGLERLAMALAAPPVDNIYDTDLLKPVMDLMAHATNHLRNKRVIADHLRASVFLIADGVIPSNTDRGYILRRLIRRAAMNTTDKKLTGNLISTYVDTLAKMYDAAYPELTKKKDPIKKILNEEALKFAETLERGMREFDKIRWMAAPNEKMTENNKTAAIGGHAAKVLPGDVVFNLFQSFGFPFELTEELAKERGAIVSRDDFNRRMSEHQSLSRTGAEQKFKGGLADANDPMVVRYHTATHLLHQALHDVLGDSVMQKGSNITAERLRFDFSHGAKMTDEEMKKVEEIVNKKIAAALPMNQVVMARADAEKTGARHFFGEKYGNEISIYFIGPASNPPVPSDLDSAYSKEFCGGPHVKNTMELGGPEGKWRFKIQKQEAVAQGIRRIKAVLA